MVQQQVLELVQRTLDGISNAVAKGTTVELRNFGALKSKYARPALAELNQPEKDVPIPRAPW